MRTIYLDNAATTCCDARVAQIVLDVMTRGFGNPSSLHSVGLAAEHCLTSAAEQVSGAVRCSPEEIIFTSGATEANNLALLGAARAKRRRGHRIVTTAAEHAAVLSPLRALEAEGFEIVFAPLSPDGTADPDAFASLVDESTVLVSCMLVNNETGAINDVAAVAAAVRRKNPAVALHCDAVQGLGKLPLDLKKLPVDLMTFSGHKAFGPKGVGALFVRKGTRVLPLLFGGGQQRGIRPGTENTPGIAGMGLACEIAAASLTQRMGHAAALAQRFRAAIQPIGVYVNSPENAVPFILNVSFEGLRGETLLHFLESRGVYVSSGSACARGAKSHVLTAMGLPARRIDSALRFSFSHDTTLADIDAAAAALREGATALARKKIKD